MARSRKRKQERRYSSAKKRAETHKSGFDRTTLKIGADVTFFTLDRMGTRRIDILPYELSEANAWADSGDLHYERTFFIHRGVGANNDSYVCPAKTQKTPCPICEHRMAMMKDPDADEDMIKDLAPKERQLWNVIDKDDPEKGVQLWDISFHLFGRLLDTEIRNADEDEDFDSFFHLEDGKTLKLGIGEKSFGGRTFYEVETIGFKPRAKDIDEGMLEQCHSLDELLIVLDYEKLKAIFLQTADAEDDDISFDKEPKPKKEKPRKEKPKPKSKGPVSDAAKEEKTAFDVELSAGDEVPYKDEPCEVLKVSGDGTSLLLEGQKSGEIYRGVGVDDLDEFVKDDPGGEEKVVDDEDWDEGDEAVADESSESEVEAVDDVEPEGGDGSGGDDDWDNWD